MSEEITSVSTKPNMKLIIIIGVVFVALAVGIAAMTAMIMSKSVSSEGSTKKETVKTKSEDFGVIFEVGEISSNVGEEGFIKTTVTLQVGNEEVKKELETKLPAVRNAVIKIFRSQQRVDLQKADAQDKIGNQIKETLNQNLMASGQIENVYFSEFLVQ